uniref:Uncharacterized protein n=1 Tax=Ananas comosus var. bracteatus TaxID=296719 RepID=A0A6V7Q580_ANACO|nr:unnamed protein product [Ananas comosus var. bracteatus]
MAPKLYKVRGETIDAILKTAFRFDDNLQASKQAAGASISVLKQTVELKTAFIEFLFPPLPFKSTDKSYINTFKGDLYTTLKRIVHLPSFFAFDGTMLQTLGILFTGVL